MQTLILQHASWVRSVFQNDLVLEVFRFASLNYRVAHDLSTFRGTARLKELPIGCSARVFEKGALPMPLALRRSRIGGGGMPRLQQSLLSSLP
jgi:hypothetical protein